MLKRNKYQKAFIDPISLIGIGFLIITLAVGVAVTNNPIKQFLINSRAGWEGDKWKADGRVTTPRDIGKPEDRIDATIQQQYAEDAAAKAAAAANAALWNQSPGATAPNAPADASSWVKPPAIPDWTPTLNQVTGNTGNAFNGNENLTTQINNQLFNLTSNGTTSNTPSIVNNFVPPATSAYPDESSKPTNAGYVPPVTVQQPQPSISITDLNSGLAAYYNASVQANSGALNNPTYTPPLQLNTSTSQNTTDNTLLTNILTTAVFVGSAGTVSPTTVNNLVDSFYNPNTYSGDQSPSVIKTAIDNTLIPDSYTNYWQGQVNNQSGADLSGLTSVAARTWLNVATLGNGANILPNSVNQAADNYLDIALNRGTTFDTMQLISFNSFDDYVGNYQRINEQTYDPNNNFFQNWGNAIEAGSYDDETRSSTIKLGTILSVEGYLIGIAPQMVAAAGEASGIVGAGLQTLGQVQVAATAYQTGSTWSYCAANGWDPSCREQTARTAITWASLGMSEIANSSSVYSAAYQYAAKLGNTAISGTNLAIDSQDAYHAYTNPEASSLDRAMTIFALAGDIGGGILDFNQGQLGISRPNIDTANVRVDVSAPVSDDLAVVLKPADIPEAPMVVPDTTAAVADEVADALIGVGPVVDVPSVSAPRPSIADWVNNQIQNVVNQFDIAPNLNNLADADAPTVYHPTGDILVDGSDVYVYPDGHIEIQSNLGENIAPVRVNEGDIIPGMPGTRLVIDANGDPYVYFIRDGVTLSTDPRIIRLDQNKPGLIDNLLADFRNKKAYDSAVESLKGQDFVFLDETERALLLVENGYRSQDITGQVLEDFGKQTRKFPPNLPQDPGSLSNQNKDGNFVPESKLNSDIDRLPNNSAQPAANPIIAGVQEGVNRIFEQINPFAVLPENLRPVDFGIPDGVNPRGIEINIPAPIRNVWDNLIAGPIQRAVNNFVANAPLDLLGPKVLDTTIVEISTGSITRKGEIDISLLHPHEPGYNPRTVSELDKILDQGSQLDPVKITEYQGQLYTYDGASRVVAYQNRGSQTVPYEFTEFSKLSDTNQSLIELVNISEISVPINYTKDFPVSLTQSVDSKIRPVGQPITPSLQPSGVVKVIDQIKVGANDALNAVKEWNPLKDINLFGPRAVEVGDPENAIPIDGGDNSYGLFRNIDVGGNKSVDVPEPINNVGSGVDVAVATPVKTIPLVDTAFGGRPTQSVTSQVLALGLGAGIVVVDQYLGENGIDENITNLWNSAIGFLTSPSITSVKALGNSIEDYRDANLTPNGKAAPPVLPLQTEPTQIENNAVENEALNNLDIFMQTANDNGAPINPAGETLTVRGCGPSSAINALRMLGYKLSPQQIQSIIDNFSWGKGGNGASARSTLLSIQQSGISNALDYGDDNRIVDATKINNYTGLLIYGGTATSKTEKLAHIAVLTCNKGDCYSVDSYFSDGKAVKCEVQGSNSIQCGDYNYHIGIGGGSPDALFPVIGSEANAIVPSISTKLNGQTDQKDNNQIQKPSNIINYVSKSENGLIFFTENYMQLPAGTYASRPKPPSNIILHWDGNPADPILHPEKLSIYTTYNGLEDKGSSVHFAVGTDGVLQFLPMTEDGISRSNGNSGLGDAINIEFAGQNFNKQLPPQSEIDNAVKLITNLVRQYDLPVDQITHHVGQSDVNPEFVELIQKLVNEELARNP